MTAAAKRLRSLLCRAAMAMVFGLAGCAMFAPPERGSPPLPLPQGYGFYAPGDPAPGRWWRSFESDELNRLVESALADNFTIRTAWARLNQALAQAAKAGADLYPQVEAQAAAGNRRTRVRTDAGTSVTGVDEYQLGLAAAYELDLWGRLAAGRRAERLQAAAADEDLNAAAVTVSAEVVNTWTDLVALRRQISILSEQIELNRNLLELQRFRFQNGQANALEVLQQMENLASIQAEMPPLEARAHATKTALALLTGRAGEIEVEGRELPELIPLPEAGLPSDLLALRPDVRAAGLRLQAADWRIASARADRLPSLNITAGAAYSSTQVDLLFSNWITTLAANLSSPLFDAGRRRAEVSRTRAVAEERLSEYAETVATAFKEVQDGLALEVTQREYIRQLEEQLAAARLAMQEARLRYLNGQSDYLNYLIEIQNVQRLERAVVAQKAEQIKIRVGLYRALGGDWTHGSAAEKSVYKPPRTQAG